MSLHWRTDWCSSTTFLIANPRWTTSLKASSRPEESGTTCRWLARYKHALPDLFYLICLTNGKLKKNVVCVCRYLSNSSRWRMQTDSVSGCPHFHWAGKSISRVLVRDTTAPPSAHNATAPHLNLMRLLISSHCRSHPLLYPIDLSIYRSSTLHILSLHCRNQSPTLHIPSLHCRYQSFTLNMLSSH